jgi:hypothetical protein
MKKILSAIFILSGLHLFSQVDDMQRMADSLEALNKPAHEFVGATFKATRVINFPTVETVGLHGLDFRIQHRFGPFNDGSGNPAYNNFGLDGGACIRLSLDYGITNWLMVGVGRTSLDKLCDASAKVRCLRQTTDNAMPVSVTVQGCFNYTFMHDPNKAVTGVDKYHFPVDRISYATSLIVGRKFNDNFSLELNGFWVHYNIVDNFSDKNDIFAAGFSGRYKLTKRFALTVEYAHRLNKYTDPVTIKNFYDPLGFGFDLETGGHVFQIHFTNQFGMNEAQYIPYTTSNWMKVEVRLGFNISRIFALGKHPGSTY